jgi:hypothetical protein
MQLFFELERQNVQETTIWFCCLCPLPLTSAERHNLPKMGDKTLSFVGKVQDYVQQYPQLCPSYITVAKFDVDMTCTTGFGS